MAESEVAFHFKGCFDKISRIAEDSPRPTYFVKLSLHNHWANRGVHRHQRIILICVRTVYSFTPYFKVISEKIIFGKRNQLDHSNDSYTVCLCILTKSFKWPPGTCKKNGEVGWTSSSLIRPVCLGACISSWDEECNILPALPQSLEPKFYIICRYYSICHVWKSLWRDNACIWNIATTLLNFWIQPCLTLSLNWGTSCANLRCFLNKNTEIFCHGVF